MRERLGEFALSLHPDKTRLIEFGRFAAVDRKRRATVMALNAVYESEFCGFSYGFRPGRGPHDALDALSTAIKIRKVNPWTILSSRAAIASGRCFPSAFGMYVRRDGCGWYAPRWTRSCRSLSRGSRSAS